MSTPGYPPGLCAIVHDFRKPALARVSSWPLPDSSSSMGLGDANTWYDMQKGHCRIVSLEPQRERARRLSSYKGDPRGTAASKFWWVPQPNKVNSLWWEGGNNISNAHRLDYKSDHCLYSYKTELFRIISYRVVGKLPPSAEPVGGPFSSDPTPPHFPFLFGKLKELIKKYCVVIHIPIQSR